METCEMNDRLDRTEVEEQTSDSSSLSESDDSQSNVEDDDDHNNSQRERIKKSSSVSRDENKTPVTGGNEQSVRDLDRELEVKRQEKVKVEKEIENERRKTKVAIEERQKRLRSLEEEIEQLERKKSTQERQRRSGTAAVGNDKVNGKETKNENEKEKEKEEVDELIENALDEWEKKERKRKTRERKQREEKERKTREEHDDSETKEHEEILRKLQKDLLRASEKRDVDLLGKAVRDVEQNGCVDDLKHVYDKARTLLTSLELIRNMNDAIASLTQSKVTEVRSLKCPPKVVQDVIRATAVLIGEEVAQDWASCQKLLSSAIRDDPAKKDTYTPRQNFLTRIKKFDDKALDSDNTAKATKILKKVERRDVLSVCVTAGIFYDWTVGKCEVYRQNDECGSDCSSAGDASSRRSSTTSGRKSRQHSAYSESRWGSR